MSMVELIFGVVSGIVVTLGGMMLFIHGIHWLLGWVEGGRVPVTDNEDEVYHRFYNGRG